MSTEKSDKRGALGEQISKVCFVFGALGLVFLLGGILAHSHDGYGRMLGDAVRALRAVDAQNDAAAQLYPLCLWYFEGKSERGLLRHDASQSYAGLTLCLSGAGGEAVLIDNDGRERHRWDAPFNAVWPQPTQVARRTPDRTFHIRRGHVFPNGDLLALYESPVHTPYGCGLARLDRSGKPIWTYDANTHHDFSVGEEGRIYVLTHEIRREPFRRGWQHLKLPVVEEFVCVLSPEGKEIQKLSLFELVRESPFYRPDTTQSTHEGDVLHSNTVNLIGPEFAAHYDGIEAGDLMICLRSLNLVFAVSPSKGKIVWATTGPWGFPHDPDPLPNGNLLVFDNCYASGMHDGSRVLEYDPRGAGSVVWQYAGSETDPFRSTIRSVQQLLPNDNVLITESDLGRIFEVTRSGEIVWEYVNPARDGEHGKLIAIYCGGRRYSEAELPFLSASAESGVSMRPSGDARAISATGQSQVD